MLRYKGHKDTVNCLSFSPDGKTVASAGNDGSVQIWDASTGERALASVVAAALNSASRRSGSALRTR